MIHYFYDPMHAYGVFETKLYNIRSIYKRGG